MGKSAYLLALELSGLLEPHFPEECGGFPSRFGLSWDGCPPLRPPVPAEDGRLLAAELEAAEVAGPGDVPGDWLSEARLLFGILPFKTLQSFL